MLEAREHFESWYQRVYWDFRNHGVRYDKEKDQYNHYDVDLAYNSFMEGWNYVSETA
jgi:hypothetical protein